MDEIKGIRIVSLTGEKEYGIEDSEVREELANVVDGAPEELDSFKEAFEKFKEGGEALAGIAGEVAAVGKAVADETTRAEQAENALDNKIAAEADRAKEAENKLANAITEESKVTDKKIAAEIDKIKDGDTIVGQAREIHSRNGKTVPDSFLARTTAGSGTIGDGVASLKSVGGNIVKNIIDLSIVTATNSTKIDSGNISIFQRKGNDRFGFTIQTNKVVGHKYYFKCFTLTPIMDNIVFYLDGVALQYLTRGNNTWIFNSVILTCQNATGNTNFNFGEPGSYKNNYGALASMLLIDLTEMFGAGKEPTKEECDRLFGTMDALPQGLSIANPTEFKSTGFNQFNPDNVLEGKAVVDNAIVSGDKKIAVIPCLPCRVGVGENNGYCIHGEFGEDIKVYLTPLNPMEVEGELYMHELTKDATTDTYVPLIKGYMLVEVPTTANLCAHFLWSEDKCERDTYEPYFESKVELPDIPQMSEWGLAGIQSSGTPVCDEIDFERGVYVKRIGSVDLGSLIWNKYLDKFFVASLVGAKDNTNMDVYSNCATSKYSNATPFEIYNLTQTGISLGSAGILINGRVLINDPTYTDTDSLKAALQGVILYYELVTPEEYPLPKVDNNYISSDYGVERFDSAVPCNANNLYYMRSLAGETRNFLDRMYDNTAKTDAKEVADYITNGIESNKELATNAPNLALRALFIAAGAEYNDSGADITKTAPWEETVIHKAGHYYLNGLGDITEEQMAHIYNAGKITSEKPTALYSKVNIRTTLKSGLNGEESAGISYYYLCSGNKNIETFCATTSNQSLVNNIHASFIKCNKLTHILPVLNINPIENVSNLSKFLECYSLTYCKLMNLKVACSFLDSPNIGKESILFIIQNAKPISAITITLHHDAYTRIANQPDIIEALEAQPLVTLVSA